MIGLRNSYIVDAKGYKATVGLLGRWRPLLGGIMCEWGVELVG